MQPVAKARLLKRYRMNNKPEINTLAFMSNRTVFPDGVKPAILVVKTGKIVDIIHGAESAEIDQLKTSYPDVKLEDFGDYVLMAGIVDSHVHVNEPGRTNWEGFSTATQAAAAGGVTTIVDMPLNSIPPTTTVKNLKIKARAARGQTFVDTGFWGGVIPGNQMELRGMVDAGVVGFKCFLCPSGVDEFPHVNASDVERALLELKSLDSVLAFHAECEVNDMQNPIQGDATLYETFLRSRPSVMEKKAIEMVCQWCQFLKVRCHIVHLSTSDALDLINETKNSGAPLTVETCHHYLTLSAEQVPKCATEFKCCPPIREKANQDRLWCGLENGVLDMVVSDHSPCVKELKASGDFLAAWGGISSLQFGLPLMWTEAKTRNIELHDLSRLLSANPAKLCRLKNKGALNVGMDADFVIWDPEKTFKVETNGILYKNKISPYKGRVLDGRVLATILRGNYIFKDDRVLDLPQGALLLKNCPLD